MALQFVLGSAGSGKSGYVFRKTVKEAQKNLKKNYYVVVPEQFTMQTQRELVRLQEKNSIMNIDVVSFQRLAYRIFDELGKTNMAVLEETGKNLVLRKVAEERMDDLCVMQGNMKKMGYISEVKSLISELTQYNIDPDTLETFIEEQNMPPAFSYKLQDILTMYRGFRSAISGMYITAEEVLEAFCDMAEESKLLQDAVLVFDGFTGFTPIQNNVLYRLMGIVSDIYVTVTIDPAEDIYSYHDMQELFAMSKKTVASLMKMAEEKHFEVTEPVVLKNPKADRFREAPVLRFLEQNLFRTRHHSYERRHRDFIPAKSKKRTAVCSRRDCKAGAYRCIPLPGFCHYFRCHRRVWKLCAADYGGVWHSVFLRYNEKYFTASIFGICPVSFAGNRGQFFRGSNVPLSALWIITNQ